MRAWPQPDQTRRKFGRIVLDIGTAPPPFILGLPEIAGFRVCDREARAALGAKPDCVFRVPDRGLFSLSFEDARNIVLARRGPHGSRHDHPIMARQTIAILPKIEEVDQSMCADIARQEWIVEVGVHFREQGERNRPGTPSLQSS